MIDLKIKYDGEIKEIALDDFFNKYLVSRIFKLLPLREHDLDWLNYLESLNQELVGANEIFLENVKFIALVNKLEGLRFQDFKHYRKNVFECITLVKSFSEGDKS